MSILLLPEVLGAGDQTVGGVRRARSDAHVAHVIRGWTAIAAEHATCEITIEST